MAQWRRMLWVAVATLALAYLAVCVLARVFERRLVYFPGPQPTSTPANFGLEFSAVALVVDRGVKLSAWFLPSVQQGLAVLVCHGNAGSIQDRLELARRLHELGASVLLFDYRGYGASDGSPDEEGTYRDAEASFDELARLAPETPIVAWGESLGGGVAVELARRRSLAGLVLESTFTSLPEVGARLYPWLPVRWIARTRYASEEKIGSIAVPVLVAHSPSDEVVPFEFGQRLFARAREPKRFVELRGAHNAGGLVADDAARGVLAEFLEALRA